MPTFTFTSPGGKSYSVDGPDGATPEQAFGVLQSQLKASGSLDYYKNMGGSAPVDPTEGMSGPDQFLAGVGMGMARLGRGVGQAVGAVDQSQIDEAHKLEAPLANTGAGKAGNVVGTVAALAPTVFIPGANTVAGAAAIGAGTSALTTEGDFATRGKAALGGAIGGAGGIAVGRALSKGFQALGNSAKATAADNAVINQTIQEARDAGYRIPPSEMAQGAVGRFALRSAEAVGGKAATGQTASIVNQKVTNGLVRQDLGLAGSGQIKAAELESLKRPLIAAYEEAGAVSPTAKDALKLWRQSNYEVKRQMAYYRRSLDPAAEDAANAARADAQTYMAVLENEAQAAGKGGLATKLKEARVKLGKIGTVENAINDAHGDVSAIELRKAMERGVPLSDGMKKAATFAQAFEKFAQTPKTRVMPGVSKLDAVGAAMLPMALGPKGLALAAVPYVTRNALLSRPAQAALAPSVNAGARQLAIANALGGRNALSVAGASGNVLSRN